MRSVWSQWALIISKYLNPNASGYTMTFKQIHAGHSYSKQQAHQVQVMYRKLRKRKWRFQVATKGSHEACGESCGPWLEFLINTMMLVYPLGLARLRVPVHINTPPPCPNTTAFTPFHLRHFQPRTVRETS